MPASLQSRPEAGLSRGLLVGFVALWALAVPVAAALGVLGLRAAGSDGGTAVITQAQAFALAAAAPTPAATPTPTPAPTPTPSSPVGAVVERRVPGAVLGLRCSADGTAELVWAVPEPGWFAEEARVENGLLMVRLETGREEVRVSVACQAGVPLVVAAERKDD